MTPANKGSLIERSARELVRPDAELQPGEAKIPAEPAEPAVLQGLMHETVDHPLGEAAPLHERLIVAPCPGRFKAGAQLDDEGGQYVLRGQEIGRVLSSDGEMVPVKAAFSGWIMGYLVPKGSPVRANEPVAWLRPH